MIANLFWSARDLHGDVHEHLDLNVVSRERRDGRLEGLFDAVAVLVLLGPARSTSTFAGETTTKPPSPIEAEICLTSLLMKKAATPQVPSPSTPRTPKTISTTMTVDIFFLGGGG